MKVYGGRELSRHLFLALALEIGRAHV
jgi:hypothetical protein